MGQFSNKYDRTVLGGALQLSQYGSTAANAFWGRTAIFSSSNVVSTNNVASNSLIFVTVQPACSITSVGTDPALFGVTSISHQGFFLIGTVSSVVIQGSFTAMWMLANPILTAGVA